MRYLIPVFIVLVLIFASSCQKCYECKQYCAYCEATNGVKYKICANKDVNHFTVDSMLTVYRGAGFNCNLLNNDKNVCDQPSKLNDALNYYYLEDYYCDAK